MTYPSPQYQSLHGLHLPKIRADVTPHSNPYITYIDAGIFGIHSLIIGGAFRNSRCVVSVHYVLMD
jgi:hypothetical protein